MEVDPLSLQTDRDEVGRRDGRTRAKNAENGRKGKKKPGF